MTRGMEHADTGAGLVKVPEVRRLPSLREKRLKRNIPRLNINFQSRQQPTECSAVRQNEVKSSLFCLGSFFFLFPPRSQ